MANLSIRNLAAAIRARIDPSYRIDLYIPERGPINLKNCLLNAPRGEGIGLDRIITRSASSDSSAIQVR